MDLFNYRYHVYRRRPGVGGTLNCTPEPGNRHEMHAVFVKHLDGVTIGHVPRNFCNVISTCLNIHHILVHAKACYTGGIVNDGPVQGGDQKLPCIYLLKFVDFNGMKRAGDILKIYIPNDFVSLKSSMIFISFIKLNDEINYLTFIFTKMKFNS